MLKENKNKLYENHLLPDPKGLKDIYAIKAYHKEISALVNAAIDRARVEALTTIVEKVKAELIGQLICILDENNKQKIIFVNNVIIDKKEKDKTDAIFLVEEYEDKDSKQKERKVRFAYEVSKNGDVFNIGNFLDFFEEHFMGKYIQFSGKSVTGGGDVKFRKQVIKIGISNDISQDYILVECDDNTRAFLYHDQPIKLLEQFLKELDPYSEEDWDN